MVKNGVGPPTGPDFGVLVVILQTMPGLLLLSVSAVTPLVEERARGSLEVILATPLSSQPGRSSVASGGGRSGWYPCWRSGWDNRRRVGVFLAQTLAGGLAGELLPHAWRCREAVQNGLDHCHSASPRHGHYELGSGVGDLDSQARAGRGPARGRLFRLDFPDHGRPQPKPRPDRRSFVDAQPDLHDRRSLREPGAGPASFL